MSREKQIIRTDNLDDEIDYAIADEQDELVRGRIKEVLRAKGTSFSAVAGGNSALQGRFQRQLKKATVSFEIVNYIARTFPDISGQWLLTGEGEMLRDTSNTSITVNAPNNKNTGNQVIGDGAINDCKSDMELIRELFEQNKKLQDALIKLSIKS